MTGQPSSDWYANPRAHAGGPGPGGDEPGGSGNARDPRPGAGGDEQGGSAHATGTAPPGGGGDEPGGAWVGEGPLGFHRRLPGYEPTRLVDADGIADTLGLGRVWVKDESRRLGLPAFKMLGASWATYLAVQERLGEPVEPWSDVRELAERVAPLRPHALATATDGNHGRAVARMAALLGFDARVFVPAGTVGSRIEAIQAEGATVTVVDGDYDEAVGLAAAEGGPDCLVIADVARDAAELPPRWVIDGYATIFAEIDAELAGRGAAWPDVVVVPVGVGALATAAVRHYRAPAGARPRPHLVTVEPVQAACLLASLRAGRLVTVPGPHDSIMAGLNCGTPSVVAWPELVESVDLAVAVDDERARESMRALADAGVVAGETGAAALAGLIELCAGPDAARHRAALGLDVATSVLVLCTEGATDPAAWERVVGRPLP